MSKIKRGDIVRSKRPPGVSSAVKMPRYHVERIINLPRTATVAECFFLHKGAVAPVFLSLDTLEVENDD